MKKKCYFVCSSISNGLLINKQIESISMREAINTFESLTKLKPQHVEGPYFKKRGWSLKDEKKVTFTQKALKAIYDGWLVKAIVLSDPPNTAFLFFDKRQDGQIIPPPTTDIVNIGDLQIL